MNVRKFVSDFKSSYGNVGRRKFMLELAGGVQEGRLTAEFARQALTYAEDSDIFIEEVITVDQRFTDQGTAKTSLEKSANIEGQNLNVFAAGKATTLRLRGYRYNPKAGDISSIRGFNNIMVQLRKKTNNLLPLFKTINADFFATNEFERFSQGATPGAPSGFPDLMEFYKAYKTKHNGNPYPILVWSGDLKRSLTKATDPNAISKPGKKSLQVGTRIPYAGIHQEGGTLIKWRSGGTQTTNVAARPPVSAGSLQRVIRWRGYAQSFMSGLDKGKLKNV